MSRPKEYKITAENEVTTYLTNKIRTSGKSNAEIAHETGLTSGNVVTMIQQGRSKLPIARVTALSKAINADARHLLKAALSEYMPDALKAIRETGLGAKNQTEEAYLQAIRELGDEGIKLKTDARSLQSFKAYMKDAMSK